MIRMVLMFLRMELKDFLKVATKRERAEVAVACNDSVSYLYQIAGNHRYASPLMATQIERYPALLQAYQMAGWNPFHGRPWFGIQRSFMGSRRRLNRKVWVGTMNLNAQTDSATDLEAESLVEGVFALQASKRVDVTRISLRVILDAKPIPNTSALRHPIRAERS
ncbi:MAG: hypothetical protein R3E62_09870 [Pseudomonadales bacterium]